MAKPPTSDYDQNPSSVTLGLALNMAWQLAIVVLVPIIGGHYIDNQRGNGSIGTIIGLAIASIGMIVVIRQTLSQLNESMKLKEPNEDD